MSPCSFSCTDLTAHYKALPSSRSFWSASLIGRLHGLTYPLRKVAANVSRENKETEPGKGKQLKWEGRGEIKKSERKIKYWTDCTSLTFCVKVFQNETFDELISILWYE